LIGTGEDARLFCIFLSMLLRDSVWEYGRDIALSALIAPKLYPFLAIQLPGDLRSDIPH